MRSTALLSALAVALCCAGPLTAGNKHYVPAAEVKKNTEKILKSIEWGSDLEALKAQAAKEKRLIFWLQLVGALDGGL